ncbi:MAG: FAD-dependent oxidoreductase [Lentimonas sp.]
MIVGAGLAGCLLAWRFKQAGLPFRIIGSTTLPSAWSVAAGIINPVTGRWMTKSWNIDTLLPEAERTYCEIENTFKMQVFHRMPVRRYCQNAEDVKRCGRRSRNPRYANVLGEYSEASAGPQAIADTHGSFEILLAGYVDLPLLIETLHKHFLELSMLSDQYFAHSQLQAMEGGWRYESVEYRQVVFCEGTGIKVNPWFNKLPLTPAKGETLILRSDTLSLPPSIYHSNKWLLPYQPQRFRIGATYDDTDPNPSPTEAGKAELLQAAAQILSDDHNLEVEAHMAGLRPSTKDARPFVGEHPTAKGLFVLNGLGSKGASIGPEMSRQLFEYLLNNQDLDPVVDIQRFDPSA